MTHPEKEDMQLILSSSKLEDFIHFEGLPHLYSGRIISDATEATKVIKEVSSKNPNVGADSWQRQGLPILLSITKR